MKLEVGSASDVGLARKVNQDSIGVYRPSEAAEWARKGELFLVADGMGGHQGGEIASRLAIDTILRHYGAFTGDDLPAALEAAVQQANAAVLAQGGSTGAPGHMGTTCVGALVRTKPPVAGTTPPVAVATPLPGGGADLHIINVGDSRAYRIRGGQIEQLSRDHSIVADQVEKGMLGAEQARHMAYRNQITRALGQKPSVEVDHFSFTLEMGDVILLCSDGLVIHVSDAEIADIVTRFPPAQAVNKLVALAKQRGGKDNISVIVVKAVPDGASPLGRSTATGQLLAQAGQSPSRRGQLPARGLSRYWLVLALGAAAVVLAGVLIFALVALRSAARGSPTPVGRATAGATPSAAPISAKGPSAQLTPAASAPRLPSTAPAVRPIQVTLGAGSSAADLDLLARDMGYSSALELTTGRLQGTILRASPVRPGVLIAGAAQPNPGQGCEFQVTMGKATYTLNCPPGGWPNAAGRPKAQDLVRAVAVMDRSDLDLKPVTIDVWRAKPDSAEGNWTNWYHDNSSERPLWVYTVTGPHTVGDASQYKIADGEPVLLYAEWSPRQVEISKNLRVGKLDGEFYKLVAP